MVFAEEKSDSIVTQALVPEQLDADKVGVELKAEDAAAADLALEQSLVDGNGMVAVFIEMEGDSSLRRMPPL